MVRSDRDWKGAQKKEMSQRELILLDQQAAR